MFRLYTVAYSKMGLNISVDGYYWTASGDSAVEWWSGTAAEGDWRWGWFMSVNWISCGVLLHNNNNVGEAYN